MPQEAADMMTACGGDEIIGPKGAHDSIVDGEFIPLEFAAAPDRRCYVWTCRGQTVAAREDEWWKLQLRRGRVQ